MQRETDLKRLLHELRVLEGADVATTLQHVAVLGAISTLEWALGSHVSPVDEIFVHNGAEAKAAIKKAGASLRDAEFAHERLRGQGGRL